MNENYLKMMSEIARLETGLESLIHLTQQEGNFCLFYPLECLEKLQIMKIIVDTEISGIAAIMREAIDDDHK